MARERVLVAAVLLGPLAAGPTRAAADLPFGVAVLQGLDKVTARVSVIEAPVDREVRFGTLRIIVRACYETPPTEPPESAAFLEIQALDGAEAAEAFTGWMFASTPAVSALEHPVYDVWVIDCREPLGEADALPTPNN
jgi:hypothetical protein